MSDISEMIDIIQEIAALGRQNEDNPHSIIGVVQDIDLENNVCSVQPLDINRTTIENVLLSSDDGATPLYVPAKGTQVTVTLFGANSGYIAQHGALNSVAIAGKDYGGVVIVAHVNDKFNNLEKKVNTLINWLQELVTNFNSHTHSYVGPSGPATTGTGLPTESKTTEDTLELTKISDLENTVVQHGKGENDNIPYFQKYKVAETDFHMATQNWNIANNKYDNINKSIQTLESTNKDPQTVFQLNQQLNIYAAEAARLKIIMDQKEQMFETIKKNKK